MRSFYVYFCVFQQHKPSVVLHVFFLGMTSCWLSPDDPALNPNWLIFATAVRQAIITPYFVLPGKGYQNGLSV